MILAAVAALYALLVHEIVHCMRTVPILGKVPDWFRILMFSLPISVWYPYFEYVRSHTTHHRDASLTVPDQDPEIFYFRHDVWQNMTPVLKMIMIAHQTFAGRMILGPVIAIYRLFAGEIRRYLNKERNVVDPWLYHLAGLVVVYGIVSLWAGMPWWQYLVLIAWPYP